MVTLYKYTAYLGADDPSNFGVMGIAESDLYSAQQGATYATKAAPYTLASQWVMSFEGSDEVIN